MIAAVAVNCACVVLSECSEAVKKSSVPGILVRVPVFVYGLQFQQLAVIPCVWYARFLVGSVVALLADSNDSDERHGNTDGGDRESHRRAGNEHCRRARCKHGCRAARSKSDCPVSRVDHKPDNPGASSVAWAERHEGVGKAWQAGRICEGCVERLGASHVVLHRTVGQEL